MTYTLSADDLKAIKMADRLAVHLKPGGATIRAIKKLRATSAGPFASTSGDVEREIPVNHQTTETAFFLVYGFSGQNGTLTALRMIIRAGDELYLRARPNNNQYVNDAGLFVDELLVSVRRPGLKAPTVLHEFELTHSICPNNSARAIQVAS